MTKMPSVRYWVLTLCSVAAVATLPLSAAVSPYDQVVLGDLPTRYWLMASGSAVDGTGNSAPGTYYGGTLAIDMLPNGDSAGLFNGVNSYFEIDDDAALEIVTTGTLTIEAWIKPTVLQFPASESSGYVHWMGKGEEGQQSWAARMYNLTNAESRPNRISGYAFNLDGGVGAGSYFQDSVMTTEWIHYALVINTVNTNATYPTGYTKLFKNGQLRDQDSLADDEIVPQDGAAPMRIGTRDMASFFQGAIAKVALYDYELSESRLAAHFSEMFSQCLIITGALSSVEYEVTTTDISGTYACLDGPIVWTNALTSAAGTNTVLLSSNTWADTVPLGVGTNLLTFSGTTDNGVTVTDSVSVIRKDRASSADAPVMSAYFISWGVYDRNYHVSDIPADMVTHINYAFAEPVYNSQADTGALRLGDPYADVQQLYPGDTTNQLVRGSFNQLRILKTEYPKIRTLISVGGWTFSGGFSDIAASENARLTFGQSVADFVTTYGFDGVDIDWEFPVDGGASGTTHRPEDAENFILLLQRIRRALDDAGASTGRRYLLTTTASAPYNKVAVRYRLPEMVGLVDWIHVMAYNYSGSWSSVTGHTAPLFENPAAEVPRFNVDETIRAYLDGGAPPAKLVLGVPFVGFGVRNVRATNHGLFQRHAGACTQKTWTTDGIFDYEDLEDGTQGNQYVNANGFVRYWDQASAVPYLYSISEGVFISYEDSESIGLKVEYARSKRLRGMMYWSMDADAADVRLQTMMNARLSPPAIAAVRSVASGTGGDRDLEIEWYGRMGHSYGVWFSTNLMARDWQRATWLVDPEGQVHSAVSGSNATVVLMDTNYSGQGFYQLRQPGDDIWP